MNSWRWVHTAAVAALLAGVAVVGLVIPDARAALALAAGLLIALFLVVGWGIVGRLTGAWIDERNKMTLSRFQIIAWTIVVLAAWSTAVLRRLADGATDPLGVAVPEQLWWLLGISTASLVGSPLILATKKRQRPNREEAKRTISELDDVETEVAPLNPRSRLLTRSGTDEIRSVGVVEVRPTPKEASWADLFRGDETGNAAFVDVGKAQMFLFTAVVLVVYVAALWSAFGASGTIPGLPALPESMLALLGISHAGYLTTKAVSHSAPPED